MRDVSGIAGEVAPMIPMRGTAPRVLDADAALEPRLSYVVARLERAVRAAIAERVQPYGLTTLQYTALSLLGTLGKPVSASQLARRAYMTPQAMTVVLDALERQGLVRRNPDPNHGRILPARLTPKGRRVLTACDEAVDAFEDLMLDGVDLDVRAELRATLIAAVRRLGAGFPD